MSCECRICLQIKELRKHIDLLKEAGLDDSVKFFEDIYDELMHVGLDNDVNKSIIEGSWPIADENIKTARERYKLKQEETE